MKRLTTDMPEDNIETALNLFYVKDEWTWVRSGGPAPEYDDISLCDYVRMIANEHNLSIDLNGDDHEVSDAMAEQLFDGTDTIEGIVATLYTAGWAFAEIRQRLKGYEDTGLKPEEIKALLDPPNPPLTLEELREMDGEPVWIQRTDSGPSRWAIMGDMKSPYGVYFGTAAGGLRLPYDDYGKTWLAYRRKPEEQT